MPGETDSIEPATDYERMLDVYDLDCSRFGCWSPMQAIAHVVMPTWEGNLGFCLEHLPEGAKVLEYLET